MPNSYGGMYPSGMLERLSLLGIIDSPLSWGVVGFVLGLALGVTTVSMWLVSLGLGLFLVYLWRHGPAREETEGRLFAAGPTFMMSWVVGFIVNSLAF